MGLIFSTCSGPMLLIEQHYERIIRGERGISEASCSPRSIMPAPRSSPGRWASRDSSRLS